MITEKELFDRLVDLETQKIALMEDIKQLKTDAKYDEDMNPKGLDKEVVKVVGSAASLYAKQSWDEKFESAKAVYDKVLELTEKS